MKATVWKNNLKEGLDIVERGVARAAALPILQNILLSAKKGVVEVAGTDLQIGITYTFLANVEKEGKCVFPGRFLSSLLGVASEEQVHIAFEQGRLAVSSGAHKVNLNTLDAEEFPIIPPPEGETPIEVETAGWCRGLAQVVGMVGQSQTRPEISGVLVALERKTARLVATDSFRLAEKTIPFEKENTVLQAFILPQKTARELIAIFGERPGKTRIYPSATQAAFEWRAEDQAAQPRIQVVSRLIEGEYPRYEEVIPSGEQTKARLSRGDFLNHVKAAGIFAGKTNEVRIAARPAKKEMAFFAQNTEAGKHASVLPGEVTGNETEVAFNWRFLAEGVANLKGETAELGLNGEDGPALLRAAGQEGYRYVIMPIKA